MQKVLDQAGLKAGSSDGLGHVTRPKISTRPFLPARRWLTFSNQAYLHFAQNCT